jgi:hypothetical protein
MGVWAPSPGCRPAGFERAIAQAGDQDHAIIALFPAQRHPVVAGQQAPAIEVRVLACAAAQRQGLAGSDLRNLLNNKIHH